MTLLGDIFEALYFILPAYFANSSPTVLGKGSRYNFSIDRGKLFFDGRRIFGDSKTIRGLVGGICAGLFIGFIQFLIRDPEPVLGFLDHMSRAFLLSLGTHFGDLFGSFIKRRLDIMTGGPFPIMDQLSFLIFALGLTAIFYEVPLKYVLILLPITLGAHLGANILAYKAGIKDVWW
ncbi:MAG: CDP-2,3-bis-(O-geranylgeranyl)-sn-glycerol synthase [Candidatus Hodarchaeota archaeon]